MTTPNITAILKSGKKIYARSEDFDQDLSFWNPISRDQTVDLLAEINRDQKTGLLQINFISSFELDREFRFKNNQFFIPKAGEELFLKEASRVASIFGTLPEVDRLFLEFGAIDARRIREKREFKSPVKSPVKQLKRKRVKK